MKSIFRLISAACMLSASSVTFAQGLPQSFSVGYNEAWISDTYVNWLASNYFFPSISYPIPSAFDGSLVNKLYLGMARGNAKLVRIFLFPAGQGISDTTLSLAQEFITNLEAVLSIARQNHMKVELVSLVGNDFSVTTASNNPPLYGFLSSVVSQRTGMDALAENIGNILATLKRDGYLDVVAGLDLFNEIELAMNAGYFRDLWIGARNWIGYMAAKIHGIEPSVPLTTSAGASLANLEIALGFFSGLGLNYYDFHWYSDSGAYPLQTAMCLRARLDNVKIILGEFGQKSAVANDNLQRQATANFLRGAKRSCFSAALAWKFEDVTQTYSYVRLPLTPDDLSYRPAYYFIKNF